MSSGLRYGCPYDAPNIHRDAQNFSAGGCSKVVPKCWGPCGRNWRNYTGVSTAIVILTICIFNQKYYTTSGDKHCKLSHLYIDLTFRMLVNIHFQWWSKVTVTDYDKSICLTVTLDHLENACRLALSKLKKLTMFINAVYVSIFD